MSEFRLNFYLNLRLNVCLNFRLNFCLNFCLKFCLNFLVVQCLLESELLDKSVCLTLFSPRHCFISLGHLSTNEHYRCITGEARVFITLLSTLKHVEIMRPLTFGFPANILSRKG